MNDSNGLPKGWTTASLEAITNDQLTCNPKRERSGLFKYVDIDALDNTQQIISSPKELPVEEAPSRARMLIREGDVIFSLVRPYLKNIAIVPADLDDELASTAYCVLRPAKGLHSRFIFYQVVQQSFINALKTYGNSPPSARDDEFFDMKVVIAPTEEQSRIVLKIEELFSDLDAGVKALERAKANLKRYRAAILKAAVEGKLTEEWRTQHPDTEPASELIERILVERRRHWEEEQLASYESKGKQPPKNWTARYKPPVEVDEDKIPPNELPPGWCWTTIDSIAFVTKLAGFEYTKYVNYDPDGDLPVIKAENAGRLGFKRTEFSRVKSETVAQLERSQLSGGEVLMVFVGAGVGQVATIPDGERYFLGPNISMIRPDRTFVNPNYLEYFLRSPVGFRLAMSFTKAVAQPSLSMGTIRQIPVAIPPLEEQNRIVECVSEAITTVDHTFAHISTTIKRASRLRQSILKHAFEGKLVPQDPNDEPAGELLARIAAERKAASEENGSPKTKRPRKKKAAKKDK